MESPQEKQPPVSLTYASGETAVPNRFTPIAITAVLLFSLYNFFVVLLPDLHNHVSQSTAMLWASALLVAALLVGVAWWTARRTGLGRRGAWVAMIVLLVAGSTGAARILGSTLFFGTDPHVITRRVNACQRNVMNIALALNIYSSMNGGRYPQALQDLVNASLIAAIDIAPPATPPYNVPNAQPYVYLGDGLTRSTPSWTLLLYEPLANHSSDGLGMHLIFSNTDLTVHDRRAAKRLMQRIDNGPSPVILSEKELTDMGIALPPY